MSRDIVREDVKGMRGEGLLLNCFLILKLSREFWTPNLDGTSGRRDLLVLGGDIIRGGNISTIYLNAHVASYIRTWMCICVT